MNWRNIALLLRFDFFYSLARLKGWVFLVPFALFWFITFYYLVGDENLIGKFTSSETENLMKIYGYDTVTNLFINHPISISLPHMLLVITTPFFIVLAAYGQFCTDMKAGFYRFLTTRCTRIELFLGQFLSAICLVFAAYFIVTIISTVLSLQNDGFPVSAVILYALQTYFAAILYALPYIALMALLSAFFNSQVGVLFVGMGFCGIVYLFFIYSVVTNGVSYVAFSLPIGLFRDLFKLETSEYFIALAMLPAYFVVYCTLAITVFDRRNF